jgi:hypothetical protein
MTHSGADGVKDVLEHFFDHAYSARTVNTYLAPYFRPSRSYWRDGNIELQVPFVH